MDESDDDLDDKLSFIKKECFFRFQSFCYFFSIFFQDKLVLLGFSILRDKQWFFYGVFINQIFVFISIDLFILLIMEVFFLFFRNVGKGLIGLFLIFFLSIQIFSGSFILFKKRFFFLLFGYKRILFDFFSLLFYGFLNKGVVFWGNDGGLFFLSKIINKFEGLFQQLSISFVKIVFGLRVFFKLFQKVVLRKIDYFFLDKFNVLFEIFQKLLQLVELL